jgi:putative phosphoesterase
MLRHAGGMRDVGERRGGAAFQMIAIISDVHGNLEALRATLAHLEDAESIYCAGDLVGYGPSPNECCDLVRERGITCVQGNHDFVCANLDRLDDDEQGLGAEDRALCRRLFDQKNTAAQAASLWTNSVLSEENKRFLRELPLEVTEHGFTMVHGRPGSKADMLNEYMLSSTLDRKVTSRVKGRILVVGHSHIPMRTSRVVNPGSVGQPRDRDWRAAFATLTDAWYRFSYIADEDMSFRFVNQLVDIHRVPYDVAQTIKRIRQQPDIPDSLGERLTVGL